MILSCLNELGYAVEWRVINAAEYGMPQRRRRVYLVAYHKSSDLYKKISKNPLQDIVLETGIIAKSYPFNKSKISSEGEISNDKEKVTKTFNKGQKKSPFLNSGVMINSRFFSCKTTPKYSGEYT